MGSCLSSRPSEPASEKQANTNLACCSPRTDRTSDSTSLDQDGTAAKAVARAPKTKRQCRHLSLVFSALRIRSTIDSWTGSRSWLAARAFMRRETPSQRLLPSALQWFFSCVDIVSSHARGKKFFSCLCMALARSFPSRTFCLASRRVAARFGRLGSYSPCPLEANPEKRYLSYPNLVPISASALEPRLLSTELVLHLCLSLLHFDLSLSSSRPSLRS